jgi:hypothetical protein
MLFSQGRSKPVILAQQSNFSQYDCSTTNEPGLPLSRSLLPILPEA